MRVAFYKNVGKDVVEKEFRKRRIPAKIFELSELEEFKGTISRRCYENFGSIIAVAKRSFGFKYPFEKENPSKAFMEEKATRKGTLTYGSETKSLKLVSANSNPGTVSLKLHPKYRSVFTIRKKRLWMNIFS